ncbi:translation initiation factor eIF-2B subunit beta [Diabrotica virgifera virgifera]|uniref:Translation initiation factor eIF2B subunit beta n=1 Tax=Diabrotica virgifera virgifera TaxID=50390 RepID=A0A6P7H2N7_DIAVI|nr:translation initiation factor eIF-2B subunit beta [Diabrotica virgifera virgifera]
MPDKDSLLDVNNLVSDIKHKKLDNSLDIALKTEELLEKLISQQQWKSARELMNLIKLRIKFIRENVPTEATATNIMRHILKIIREEYESALKKKGEGQSLHQLVTSHPSDILDYSEAHSSLRSNLLDHLGEYKVEIDSSSENIAAQASEHIHMDEMIMTVGKSNTVEKFLKSAAKERHFKVVVVEAAPFYDGHIMATRLAKSNIQTTVIPDSAVFAMMSRVNKVIIGTHTVLANGGLRAASGIHAVALAAKQFSVPVMVLSHMYKFTPMYVVSHNNEAFNICASPADVIPHSAGKILNDVEIYNPVFDYVPPELVTLFISHQGGNAPSYVYRLLSELYHQDDYDI